MKIFLTGGAGFIGSAVIRHIINNTSYSVINIDKLTYAGNLDSLLSIQKSERYNFEKIDICNSKHIKHIFKKYKPDAVMHLAAESHVDKSIKGPEEFINTNLIGTFNMLEESRIFWNKLNSDKKNKFRFHHISTDEVYGDLANSSEFFNEKTRYDPSSPYSATKAGSDHLVRAWNRTYGLPTLITNCSNNYGPYHYPEKLIPLTIINAIKGQDITVYGDGTQIRDWLYVDDHAKALIEVLTKAKVGSTYNIGGHNEKRNIDVVKDICSLLNELAPEYLKNNKKYEDLIKYTSDRPGHDIRYAIDASKIEADLGWKPSESYESGLRKTVSWFLENQNWWQKILNKKDD